MSQPTTSDVLREAARVLMEEGWGQGSEGWDEAGSRCVLGAIDGASNNLGLAAVEATRAGTAFCLWLASHGKWSGCVTTWNDAPERTAEDVSLALKQCAYDLEVGS